MSEELNAKEIPLAKYFALSLPAGPSLAFLTTAIFEFGFCYSIGLPFADTVSPTDVIRRSMPFMLPLVALTAVCVLFFVFVSSMDKKSFRKTNLNK